MLPLSKRGTLEAMTFLGATLSEQLENRDYYSSSCRQEEKKEEEENEKEEEEEDITSKLETAFSAKDASMAGGFFLLPLLEEIEEEGRSANRRWCVWPHPVLLLDTYPSANHISFLIVNRGIVISQSRLTVISRPQWSSNSRYRLETDNGDKRSQRIAYHVPPNDYISRKDTSGIKGLCGRDFLYSCQDHLDPMALPARVGPTGNDLLSENPILSVNNSGESGTVNTLEPLAQESGEEGHKVADSAKLCSGDCSISPGTISGRVGNPYEMSSRPLLPPHRRTSSSNHECCPTSRTLNISSQTPLNSTYQQPSSTTTTTTTTTTNHHHHTSSKSPWKVCKNTSTTSKHPRFLPSSSNTSLWILLLLLANLCGRVGVRASEFPDRECCDSAPPPPPQYHTTTSTTPVPQHRPSTTTTSSTTTSEPSPFPTAAITPTGEGALGVRNCLLARQQCADDPSCRSVLEIIPRVCGPESVACSTVTVNKCVAALRTVLGFPYFQPTCLCREPHLDRECNTFREFIFDHPCMYVKNKDEATYTVHALLLCEYALNACDKLPGCMQLYEQFRESCKVRDDQCKMEDANKCLSSWTKLKLSPMFGCMCTMDHQKRKCNRIFRTVHKNPCVVNVIPYDNSSRHAGDTQIQNPLVMEGTGGGRRQNASRAANVLGNGHRYPTYPATHPHASHSATSGPPPTLHSTCQTALTGCNDDQACRRLLNPVLAMCDNNCDRGVCMSNLQTFYRNVESKWALEVAFCLCKKSSVTANECLTAQEKLHPSCARKPAGPMPMLCNRLAAACKEDKVCRHRLEFYEQACAVDSDTGRCAGSTAECRRSLLGILGTQLRNLCTCSATDPRETYTCMDWQRILWFNPCVVESQTDYHREMLAALGPGEEVVTTESIVYTPSVATGVISEPVQHNGDHHPGIRQPVVVHPAPDTTHYMPPYTDWNPHPMPPTLLPMPTTTTTSTTRPTTTTLPPRYCKGRNNTDIADKGPIEEGWGKRYYRNGQCSELCMCYKNVVELVCRVLECIDTRPCETRYAVYAHAAPAYQATRGDCFCYSGSFVCVRPPSSEYNISNGVYLFIGYSKAEEKVLQAYGRTTEDPLVDAAVNKLNKMVHDATVLANGRDRRVSSDNAPPTKSECRLELVVHRTGNIIIQATLEEFDYIRDNMTAEMLHKENTSCSESVSDIAKKINKHEMEIREDVALSMLIVAEVQVHLPELSDSAVAHSPHIVLLITLVLTTLASADRVLLAS